jgi:1-hydroxycarotenoid 3,4-desaturase
MDRGACGVYNGSMRSERVIVVGGGVGGLVSAALLAHHGAEIVLLERGPTVGGKMRQVLASGRAVDAGPTVLTMRWVFEELFAALGTTLDKHLDLTPAELLARHAWATPGGAPQRLDLFADLDRSAEAIGAFAGPREAEGYRRFCAYARRIYATVEQPFLRSQRPTLTSTLSIARELGVGALFGIDGHRTLWKALGDFFHDPRLRQLFGRYATYCGSSPFLAPATLNVIAHVEREGVWLVEGGMYRVAAALAALVEVAGGTIRAGAHVESIVIEGGRATGVVLAGGERIAADAVVLNGDAEALARGLFGAAAARGGATPKERSLSAITWAMVAETRGFPLARHNVFFSSNYEAEFRQLFGAGQVPDQPTVYVCAQDRDDRGLFAGGAERLLVLVNAPAVGDRKPLQPAEVAACETRCFDLLSRSGLRVTRDTSPAVVTTPTDFERLFPATGGALYGAASHGMTSPFARPGSRTKIPGLYLTGGSAHPGAGVPMAALSGKLAAASVLADLASTGQSRAAATPGGTSTSSATTGATRSP